MRSAAHRVAWSTVVLGVSPRSSSTATFMKPSAAAPCVSSSSFSASPFVTPLRCYAAVTRVLRQSWGSERVRPWMCAKKECRTINKAVAHHCESCGTAKPVLQRWKCVDCGAVNFAGVKQCKQCAATPEKSKGYWMCADCGENNRVDELEDNAVCGFCGYDMAPQTAAQVEAHRRVMESAMEQHAQQQRYDDISFKEADEQFDNPLEGAQHLDASLRARQQHQSADVAGSSRHLRIPKVAPFAPPDRPLPSQHSRLHTRRNVSRVHEVVRAAHEMPSGPPGFDWMCRGATCGHINPGDEETCLQCSAHIQPEDWECLLCGAANHLSRSRCFSCRSQIPVCWTCAACNATTSIYDKTCRSCGVPRPPTEPRRSSEVDAEGAYRDRRFTKQRDANRGEWYCPVCTKLNFSRREECFSCGAQRAASGGSSAAAGADPFAANGWGADAATLGQPAAPQAPLHNNWLCAHCQASNFRTRHDCWKCGRASESQHAWSTETTSPHYEREGFQTGADDKPAEGRMNEPQKGVEDKWTCAKCYAANYRSRADCYRCGSRKTAVVATRASRARRPVKL